ncbi:MAG: hypothetical protein ACYTAF_10970 [Planctomycetota bacterium]|jgi:hypothetical protein
MWTKAAAAAVLGIACLLAPAQEKGEKVRETYASGALRAEYGVDSEGRKHGEYAGFHENGKKRIAAKYVHGVPEGRWREFHESGGLRLEKSYSKGRLNGDLVRRNEREEVVHRVTVRGDRVTLYPDPRKKKGGVPAHPRGLEEIRKAVAAIDPPKRRFEGGKYEEEYRLAAPYAAGRLARAYLEDALRHFRVYRYLCGVPHDLKLDPGMTGDCQHAAVLAAVLKKATHDPRKPADMDPAFHERARRGASSSNLIGSAATLRRAVDAFMHDSDAGNIGALAHRGWMLNPAMGKLGFGQAGTYVALWAVDAGRKGAPAAVAFCPAPGHFPLEYFKRSRAWSMDLPPSRYGVPAKTAWKVRMWLLDGEYDLEKELAVNHASLRAGVPGMRPALIFRPELPADLPLEDRRVLVSISGVPAVKGPAGPIVYLVHFFRLEPPK